MIHSKLIKCPPAFPENDVLKKIQIKYPVDKVYRTFLYNDRTHEIFELIKFKENFRSWFVGDYVLQGITSIRIAFLKE